MTRLQYGARPIAINLSGNAWQVLSESGREKMPVKRHENAWFFTKRMGGQRLCVYLGPEARSRAQALAVARDLEHDLRAGLRAGGSTPRLVDWWSVFRATYGNLSAVADEQEAVEQFVRRFGEESITAAIGRGCLNSSPATLASSLSLQAGASQTALRALHRALTESGYDVTMPECARPPATPS